MIQLDACFYYDLYNLGQDQKDAFQAAYPVPAAYTWHHFKNDVVAQLRKAFGAAVTPGAKAVKVAASGNRRKADVLIAAQFHRYDRFLAVDNQDHDEGICFFNAANERIANYPRQHSENCTTKHQATN